MLCIYYTELIGFAVVSTFVAKIHVSCVCWVNNIKVV